jgi:hypothetical protein
VPRIGAMAPGAMGSGARCQVPWHLVPWDRVPGAMGSLLTYPRMDSG